MDFYEDEYIDYGFLRYCVKQSYWYLNLSGKEFSSMMNLKYELAYGDKRYYTYMQQLAVEERYMKRMLDEKRFELYKQHQKTEIEDFIERQKFIDEENSKDLAYLEESIEYLEERYLPRLAAIDRVSLIDIKGNSKRRLIYLQKRYASILRETNEELVATHMEWFENYRPLGLREYTLIKRQLEIVPNLNVLMSGSRSRLKWGNIRRLLQELDLGSSENYDLVVKVHQQMLYYHNHLWGKYPQSRELNPQGMFKNVGREDRRLYVDFSLLMLN